MADEQWSWQEKGTAWYGIAIYHVTLIVPNRKPLLGTLTIPNNDPVLAKIEFALNEPKRITRPIGI